MRATVVVDDRPDRALELFVPAEKPEIYDHPIRADTAYGVGRTRYSHVCRFEADARILDQPGSRAAVEAV